VRGFSKRCSTVRLVESIAPTSEERAASMAGDDLISSPDAVMDRAFTLPAPPEVVWPWVLQLGKRRAGWYLPSTVERFIPKGRRALRSVDPQWEELQIGDVIPDYGGRNETFEVARIEPPHRLVYRSQRGRMSVSWSISLESMPATDETRMRLRLRLGPVRRRWLVATAGELIDLLTVAGLAEGLRERVSVH